MGNFPGHATPGSIFLFFAIWWTIRYSVMWASRMGGRKTSSAVCWKNAPLLCRFLSRVPMEGLCKILFPLTGLLGEQMAAHWTLIDPVTGQFHMLGNWQHTTMYLFFALSGFFDVLIALKAPVPSGIDHLSMSLAYAVEGVLFFYHLHGRADLDVRLHKLLLLAVAPCVTVSSLEAWRPNTLLLPMVRAAFTLVQGTWFWQVGWILYPPFPGHEWDLESHENMMFVSTAFCWHILGILLFMCVVYTVVYHIYQAKEKQRGTELELGPLSSHMLQAHSDSELD
ncbi:PREDICTED: transmembrane protein 45B-like [Branchiostoma belcheri]|uniref:Transmembrane protein 45B-like n=1 Tax=Branchiostoma belcheri TaxID=7741 RepID=A0A6P5ADM4_BRABE|nr:PREDICTED: transmembrane protein 45B-like [Branchiostoma belcheri]